MRTMNTRVYATATRRYRNVTDNQKSKYKESPILRDVIGDRVILQSFDVGGGRGTWRGSPFKGVEAITPDIPDGVRSITATQASPSGMFDLVCKSIEDSWSPDHLHVVPHSSGYDSRIISGAIKRLVKKNGEEWLSPGLLFVTNRWEAAAFQAIMNLQGWDEKFWTVYNPNADADMHFAHTLHFDTFWETTNAPTPCAGNLRWYLADWARYIAGNPANLDVSWSTPRQIYTGLWANETWDSLCAGGINKWVKRHDRWYCYNQMAALPWMADLVEYPLSDIDVLGGVLSLPGGNGSTWRKRISEIASPETAHIARDGSDDWKKPISGKVIQVCRESYAESWYAKNVEPTWAAPMSSHWSNGWGQYGLASLCDELIKSGVKIK